MTFIFDVTEFNIYRNALEAHLDKINFLGVKNKEGVIKFINLRDAIEVTMNTDMIRIEFSDYFYIITPGGVRQFYTKY
jgi:hypothetical protein